MKTFEEWIKGFEDTYTPKQITMFKEVWDLAVKKKALNDEIVKFHGVYIEGQEENLWHINWIDQVALNIGK